MSSIKPNTITLGWLDIWPHRSLIINLAKREVLSRYRGSWLGVLWSIINPVLLLLVYMFVFGVIFQARWPQSTGVDENFAALLFSGLVVYVYFSEQLTSAPSLVLRHENFVKKVVFPIDTLAWVSVLSSLFHFVLSLLVLFLFVAIWGSGLSLSVFALIPLYLIFTVQLVAMVWFVSALGVFIRDVVYIASFLSTALFFLSPIFYPIEAVPESFAKVMQINPLSFYIESTREIVVLGNWPSSNGMLIAGFVAILSYIAAGAFFDRVKSGFADVM